MNVALKVAMNVIVTDRGFAPEDWTAGFVALAAIAPGSAWPAGVEIGPDDPLDRLAASLAGAGAEAGAGPGVAAIRVVFPAFSDGRGFTHARRLRAMGFGGRLRAAGHVLADQYAMARRCGFDEVEIGADLAARQPQAQWLTRADWARHDYQARLRA